MIRAQIRYLYEDHNKEIYNTADVIDEHLKFFSW
jgi:hypothetical protein